jgi:hypothetical protein
MVKKTIATGVAALLVGGAIGSVGFPTEVEKEVPVYENVTVEVEKEVYVEVEKEVYVDNENLNEVLEHVYDNHGNVRYIVADLDDNELDMIVDRVVLSNEFKKFAVDAVNAELISELHKEFFDGVQFDRDDIEYVRVDSDEDEVSFVNIDFEDEDARVKVTGRFDHDDVKYKFSAYVDFKYGEYDEIDYVSVSYY